MASPASRTGKPVFIVRALRFLALLVLAIHAWYIVTTCLLILVYKAYDPPASVIMVYRAVLYGWKVEAPKPRSIRANTTKCQSNINNKFNRALDLFFNVRPILECLL